MSETKEWAFSPEMRPSPEETDFDLEKALRAMVLLHAEIPDDATTATLLGTERIGNGVVIAHGGREYVLTIGYLITEAESIWITDQDGRVQAGHALAYDAATGFGLVLPLGPLRLPSLPLGSAQSLAVGDKLVVISHGGQSHALKTGLIAIREFAGYWEYLLERALFTSPPHPHWSGAALVAPDGRLLGIGSLLTQEDVKGETFDANLFVPIDLLAPILDDMIEHGGPTGLSRPWLGIHCGERKNRLVIAGTAADGPAERAGLRAGDTITEVAGRPMSTLAEFFRAIWSTGPAGTEIPLTIVRRAKTVQVDVRSSSRQDFLKKPQRH